jgi:hypothetical protein
MTVEGGRTFLVSPSLATSGPGSPGQVPSWHTGVVAKLSGGTSRSTLSRRWSKVWIDAEANIPEEALSQSLSRNLFPGRG